ncbi:hypothetical protein Hanom_Chr16g01517621 [Helianthus anomalus]
MSPMWEIKAGLSPSASMSRAIQFMVEMLSSCVLMYVLYGVEVPISPYKNAIVSPEFSSGETKLKMSLQPSASLPTCYTKRYISYTNIQQRTFQNIKSAKKFKRHPWFYKARDAQKRRGLKPGREAQSAKAASFSYPRREVIR